MNILVIGGTRFFGIPMVNKLLEDGHEVTLATRGLTEDSFGKQVQRIKLNIYDGDSVKAALAGKAYDVVIDKMGYGSLDVKNILDNVMCGKFIHMSTAGVYQLNHMDIREDEFDGSDISLKWCSRGEGEYDDVKRQAEAALCQKYLNLDWTSVRCPYVLGKNDYTNRLLFYIEHVMKEIPMNIDNLDEQLCFSEEKETGECLAFLVNRSYVKSLNVCAKGTMSIREILDYVEKRTGHLAKINLAGSRAPYNGTLSNSLLTKKAEDLGIIFGNIHDWMPELLDYYIDCIRRKCVEKE